MPHLSRFTAPLLALVLLAGCAAPALYAPRGQGQATGYTDRQLASNRFRVTFTGNSATPRETVENYLLLRAAEVAQAAGYPSFMFDSRDTNAIPEAGPGPGWGGYWRFRPYWGYDPFGPEVDIITTTRYEAFAEIVLLTPEQASHEARAINAREIIAHLGPQAAPPAPKNPV
jgi:hypothetical protein